MKKTIIGMGIVAAIAILYQLLTSNASKVSDNWVVIGVFYTSFIFWIFGTAVDRIHGELQHIRLMLGNAGLQDGTYIRPESVNDILSELRTLNHNLESAAKRADFHNYKTEERSALLIGQLDRIQIAVANPSN